MDISSYLATQHDVDVLVRGLRLMIRIAKTAPFSKLVVPDTTGSTFLDDNTDSLTDKELEAIVRKRTETL